MTSFLFIKNYSWYLYFNNTEEKLKVPGKVLAPYIYSQKPCSKITLGRCFSVHTWSPASGEQHRHRAGCQRDPHIHSEVPAVLTLTLIREQVHMAGDTWGKPVYALQSEVNDVNDGAIQHELSSPSTHLSRALLLYCGYSTVRRCFFQSSSRDIIPNNIQHFFTHPGCTYYIHKHHSGSRHYIFAFYFMEFKSY